MKKVYIILLDGTVQFVFTSRKKAEKQLEYIKEAIMSGKWFLDENGKYEPSEDYEFLENYTIFTPKTVSYCFKNKKKNHMFCYNLLEKDVNSSLGI